MSRHPGRRGKHLQKMREREEQEQYGAVLAALDGVKTFQAKRKYLFRDKTKKRKKVVWTF